MLTKKEFNKIKERCEKATLGPWIIVKVPNKNNFGIVNKESYYNSSFVEIINIVELGEDNGGIINLYDAKFIAYARQDIPTLIKEIERLYKENEVLKYTLKSFNSKI